MACIGIVADKNSEQEIEKILLEKSKEYNNIFTIIIINEKSINNIKNIKFETILIYKNIIKSEDIFKQILSNTKYLILNSDIEKPLKIVENIDITIITYGFNSKATITASSVNENEILLCIQRNILNLNKKLIEPQEINIYTKTQNKHIEMAVFCIMLLYGMILEE